MKYLSISTLTINIPFYSRASTFKVVLGALNPFKDVLEQGGLTITGSEIHLHPQYDVPFKPNNDLALLKLPQPVNLTGNILVEYYRSINSVHAISNYKFCHHCVQK